MWTTFLKVFEKWNGRWNKCLKFQGKYFQTTKDTITLAVFLFFFINIKWLEIVFTSKYLSITVYLLQIKSLMRINKIVAIYIPISWKKFIDAKASYTFTVFSNKIASYVTFRLNCIFLDKKKAAGCVAFGNTMEDFREEDIFCVISSFKQANFSQ